ncbi:putative monooxygenase [Mycena sanguinolenta]|uniref:Putative monooxygenase n=1 Tax=Mycena sanguinolenta TaxID=230812 RepID=A0A8H6ZAI6_9AGAR|nr:putative monooxygenase [Mycena sanguinolenta]
MSGSVPIAILAAAVMSAGYLFWKSAARKNNVPPGPRRWPLIGSVLEIPQTCQWETFSKWAKTYGSIVYVDALGQPMIVINSAKVANDLLDKRSSIYSDRPILMMPTLCGGTNSFALQSYSESWRQQRKIVAQDFSPAAVRRYYPLQETEARKLVHGLIDDPSTLARQTQLRIGAIIIRVAYGHYVTDENDPLLTAGLTAMEIFSKATTPGVWAVDFLPMLRFLPSWLPGSEFLQIAKQWRKIVIGAAWDPYLWCKKNLATGTVLLPNFCAQYLAAEDGKMSEEQEEKLVWAALSMFGGGLDTNASSILTFFLAMILNPSVQHKAQDEIDRVIGPDRLPVIQDKASLPCVRGLIAEVFRWHPAAPLGIAHALTQDDVYDDMRLPKGSVVIPNAWHMLHDPEVYPNPMEFDPDRYQGLDSEMDKVTDISFGFGRRACPGKYFAEGTFFAVVSTVLATCEISPIQDTEGNTVLPDISYTSGTISAFKISVPF